MGLAAGQKAWTVAASGLLRSDASRSGFSPIGRKVLLYALSNVARSNATRSNYHSPRSFITVDDVPWGGHRQTALEPGILIDSLRITDNLNQLPNTCQFTAWGFQPREGQRVLITVGSMNGTRLFHGRVLNTEQYYKGLPKNLYTSVNAIDDTWGLDTRKVSELYTGWSYDAIVRDLIAKYAAPEYTVAVEAGLGSLDEISFTNEDLPSALTRLAKRGGYAWLVDEWAVVRFFLTDTWGTPPSIINAVHPSLDEFQMTRDLSQVITRVYVEGGGILAAATVSPGETILPLAGASTWYNPAGGTVVSGPQRVRYTGVYAGGGGGLVGPGASPSGRPIVNLASGTGLSDGLRSYAVTYTTASGESIPSPTAAITTGPLAPPATAPVVGAPTIGSGPDTGTHRYAVVFVTAAGQTPPGATVDVETGETATPGGYPVPGAPTVGLGVDPGPHEYAVSFVTAIGETRAGPISPQVVAGPMPPPPAPSFAPSTYGTGPEFGSHDYAVTFVTAIGETTPGTRITKVTETTAAPVTAPVPGTPIVSGANRVPAGSHEYVVTFVTPKGETTAGPISAPVTLNFPHPGPSTACTITNDTPTWSTSPGNRQVCIQFVYQDDVPSLIGPGSNVIFNDGGHSIKATNVPIGPPGVKWRLFWMNYNGGPFTRCDGGLFNNVDTVGYPGQTTSPGLPPTVTDDGGYVPLGDIPIGPPEVTGRRLYRRAVGAGALLFVGAIPNNTATTLTDGTQFGAGAAPPTNTAALAVTHLTTIPTGPAGTTQRKLYRTAVNASALQFLATISGNTTTVYDDTKVDADLGAAAPTVNTAAMHIIPLTEIPKGESGAGVTARKLYRRSGGAGLRFLDLLPNNSTTTYSDFQPTAALGAAPPATTTATLNRFALSQIPIGPPLVTQRYLYRSRANLTTPLYFVGALPNNTATTFTDTVTDSGMAAAAPLTNTAVANQVQITAIPIGAASVTSRKIYRTVAGGAALKLLIAIPDNTTTAYLDAVPDASLGAAPPVADTSGLQQPSGNVYPGSTSFQVASIGVFPPAGWAVIGNGQQVIRYTAIVGNSITGIPASGPGSIQAAIAYNSTVTAAPELTGIPASGPGAIRYSIRQGDEVNLWVQRDDLAAQAALAALLGTDGILEGYLQDRRLSQTEAESRGDAHLALRSAVEVGVTYTCRDVNTRAGRVANVNLPTQHTVGEFILQSVGIDRFGVPNLLPTFHAVASANRFTFADLLRAARKDGT